MDGSEVFTHEDARTFRSIIDAAPVAIQIVGQNGLFIDCNKETISMFGASSQKDIIGKPPSILSPELQPDGRLSNELATRFIEEAMTGKTVSFEWVHQKLSGVLFPAKVTLGPIEYQGKNCLMASIQDISHEKELLNNCTEAQEAQVLFKENSSGIMILSPDLKVLDINSAFEKITGYTREQGLRMNLRDFNIIERRGAVASDVIRDREPRGGTLIAGFPSGIRHLDYLYIPVLGPDGTVSRIYEIFTDNTNLIEKITESDSLIINNPVSLITSDLQGKILFANPAFIEMTKISREKLLTMSLSDFTIIEREGGKLSEMISTKAPVSGRMTADFGSFMKILDYRYIPVIDVNGTVIKAVLLYIDITSQMEKIEEISELIQNSPYGIITISSDLKILDMNQAFENITGYSRETGLKMNLKDFRIREREGGTLDEVKKTGAPVGGRMIIDLPTGIKHIEYTYIPVKNRRGEIIRYFEIFADVTSLANQVSESETLISQSPASIITMDLSGKILTVNQAFMNICQMTEETLRSMKIQDFTIVERSGASFTDTINQKKPMTGRLTVNFGTYSKILDFTYIPLLDVNGNIQKLVAMYIDLTDQIRMVAYLDESVGQIAASINRLAAGDTTFITTVLEGDDSTRKAYENMKLISTALDTARNAVARLVEDTTRLSLQAVAGNLTGRAEVSRHEGDYRKVIEGINNTLNSITGPVNEAMKVASAYASYNFAARVNSSVEMEGDWQEFRNSLDNIGRQVGDVIQRISREVKNLTDSAENATRSVGEIAEGAGQLAQNTGIVSTNAEHGKDGIAQVLRAMEDLSVTVGDVSQKTEEVSVISINSTQLARDGTELARRAEEGMKVITLSADETSRIIREIQDEMGKIGKIVRLITDIASQTNLLALNAAIEAARAGEAGRGFAVVAAEVKALATESRNSAENIAEMIATLQSKSESASDAVTKAGSAVLEGNAALTETLAVFGKLASSVEDISRNMEQVASMSEEQAANAEEITASINEVSDVMQGTSNEAMNIAGITEETAASIDHLSKIVGNVHSAAKEVDQAVMQFRI